MREFAGVENDRFQIRFHRQTGNLGVMDNFRFTVGQARGKYLVPFAHDNWFTDPGFIADAVQVMGARPGCHLCLANSVFENSDRRMLEIPDTLSSQDAWHVLPGDEFIRLYRRGGLDWTQAIVLDHEKALALGCVRRALHGQRTPGPPAELGRRQRVLIYFHPERRGVRGDFAPLRVRDRHPGRVLLAVRPAVDPDQEKGQVRGLLQSLPGDPAGPARHRRQAHGLQAGAWITWTTCAMPASWGITATIPACSCSRCCRWRGGRGSKLRYSFKRVLGRNPITGKAFKKMKN